MGVPFPANIDLTLDVLLAPGDKTRLSPLVESAQLFFLTNSWPIETKRYDSIQAILHRNQGLINQMAKTWVDMRQCQFSEATYQSDAFLKMYASYYFSVNVGKLQILLYDLLRCGELPEVIHAIDIGVGTGSTAVALLDFFYAWGIACQLHHQPFPLKEFNLVGYDRSEQSLRSAERMVQAYGMAIQRRKEVVISTGESSSLELLDRILAWVKNITWQRLDIEKEPIPENGRANFVVLSNVLNELREKKAGSRLDTSLKQLSHGALTVVIEPGEKTKTRELMLWRENFLKTNSDFSAILPCGQEHTGNGHLSCGKCWAARRESFHQPLLYQSFRQICSELIGSPKEVDEHLNKLLSWSYSVIKKGKHTGLSSISGPINLVSEKRLIGPVRMRVMGKFRERTEGQGAVKNKCELVDDPVDQDTYQPDKRKWNEYLKICTHPFPNTKFLVIKRPIGVEIPRMRFGQEVIVSNIKIELYKGRNQQLQLVPLPEDQTVIQPLNSSDRESLTDGFLSTYDESARKAVDELAYRLFGFPGMRPFQHEILGRVLCGKNVFGIAATGGGKSECFILPAMIFPGVTIVISPLKSLMTDQYNQRLHGRFGLGDLATFINGDVPFKERQARLKRMELGYYKIVYFTPEQLERGFILDSLRRTHQTVGVRYLAMDEAHCISQWGHDFRPSYLNITRRLKEYGVTPVIIALTATASRHVRQDICEELNLNPLPVDQGGDLFVYSSNRPEINFAVRVMRTTDEKVSDILDELQKFQRDNRHDKSPGAALVFLPHTGGSPENTWRYFSEKTTSKQGRFSAGVTGFASYLERTLERKVSIYHGKMDNDEPEMPGSVQKKELGDLTGRTRIQEQTRFINSVSTGIDIMVATKGFGMGIDKPNIRLIIHRSPTSNLEAYAQEAGRAGRDGDLATAILYYSPDSAIDVDDGGVDRKGQLKGRKVKSDHQIQEAFLKNKYIRKADVVVMRAFLMQVNHRLTLNGRGGPYLYFTSDEAIDFFDSCQETPALGGLDSPYQWPCFLEREPLSRESEEHRQVLQRGYDYQQKAKYINRILAALFRIRPDIDGRTHQAFLESVQETGAKVLWNRTRTFDWTSIYQSNAYFGDLLREKEITPYEFESALQADDLLPFAQRINLSLTETVGIFNDIKSAEGNIAKNWWNPSLLNFSHIIAPLFGPAAGKDSLSQWREYAGASKRATKLVAEKRAKRDGRKETGLDDWFGWPEVVNRIGWEVFPGPAFEINFEQFLEAFMQLHDQREDNDWNSYRRLLTDYIGVRDDGSIQQKNEDKKCLRSVLLGYLETYEVVVDSNCFSCSHCVPDGNFEKYPIEMRKKAIIRMAPELISLYDEMKEADNKLPEQVTIDRFFECMASEENAGKSVHNYFSGWSGKLLNDEPDHLTAQWLRLVAMTRNVLVMQHQEFINLARRLVEVLPEDCMQRFAEVLETQRTDFENDPGYVRIWIKVYRRNNQFQQESEALSRLVQFYENSKKVDAEELRAPVCRLIELHQDDGPLPDQASYWCWMIVWGRIAPDYAESLKAYSQTASHFDWDQVLLEVQEQKRWVSTAHPQAALFISWLETGEEERKKNFLVWVNDHLEEARHWPAKAHEVLLPILPDELIVQSDTLLDLALKTEYRKERVFALGLKCLAIRGDLPEARKVQFEGLFSSIPDLQAAVEANFSDSPQQTIALSRAIPYLKMKQWDDFRQWEELFLQFNLSPVQIVPFVVNVIQQVASMSGFKQGEAVRKLTPCLLEYFSNPLVSELVITKWLPIYLEYPLFLGRVLQMLHHRDIPAGYVVDPFLDKALETNWDVFLEIPTNVGYSRWQNAILMMKKVDQFLAYYRSDPGSYRIEYKHLEFLRESFDWMRDPVQGDMLIAILLELRKKCSPGWKSLIVVLVETLVLTGRSVMVEEMGRNDPELVFRGNGENVCLQTLIDRVSVPQRLEPIPPDFLIIAEKSFARL